LTDQLGARITDVPATAERHSQSETGYHVPRQRTAVEDPARGRRQRAADMGQDPPEYCGFECPFADFPPADTAGLCRTMSAVWCRKLRELVSKNTPCEWRRRKPARPARMKAKPEPKPKPKARPKTRSKPKTRKRGR
jgi:hypothetical protein